MTSRWTRCLFPLLLSVLAVAVYGTRFWTPESLFWDENYHIASAQKNIDGVMYMETHPPLGKMLIALGEIASGANRGLDTSALLSRDHVSSAQLPAGFTFGGFRLASVVLMILSVLLLYAVLLRITGYRSVAFGFASLVALDNALVVHSRAAMLEGIQIFFAMAALYGLVWAVDRTTSIRWFHYAVLGALVGLVLAVKLNGAVLLLLLVALFAVDLWRNAGSLRWTLLARRLLAGTLSGTAALLLVFLGVYYIHIATATSVQPNRTYKASAEYLRHLHDGSTWTPAGFAVGMRDHWRYVMEYSDGVPRLDVCKPGENGSRAYGWPLGGKTINYRWSKVGGGGNVAVSYTYLIGNALVWWPVLLGIVLSLGLLIGRYVYGHPERDRRLFLWIGLFTALYLSYLLAILQIDRVMYLYHYLLPLLFGIINLALVYSYVFRDGLLAGSRHVVFNLFGYVLLAATVFAYFAPFTYGTPLATHEVEQRQWLGLWKLEPVR